MKPGFLRLPLPLSKNRRVEVGMARVYDASAGFLRARNKPILRNSRAWHEYVENTIALSLEQGIPAIRPPEPGERIVIECRWFLRDERSDCVNFHDLLADALKKVLNIDDRWFLVRDVWSEYAPENPRVEVRMWVERR
jgi:hypothetical protein